VPAPQHTVSMKDLLTSGVHFGHQTRRWNPKMKQYIFGERGGIYIIDLQKSTALIDEAYAFIKSTTERGGTVLFVGTKKQCQEQIKEHAERVGMPYVANRWLGGLLTNFTTLSKRIKRMHELRQLSEDGSLDLLPTREAMQLRGDLRKLEQNLGGVGGMERLPAAVFVIDPRKEAIVVKEARKLKIPIIGLVDTNCDPDEIDYVIPGNDDAIRSCALIVRVVADAVAAGRQLLTEAEMKAEAERKAAEEAAIAEAVAAAEKAAAEAAAAEAAAAKAAAAEAIAAAVVTEAVAEEAVAVAVEAEATAEAVAESPAADEEQVVEAIVEAVAAEEVAEVAVAEAVVAEVVAEEAVSEAIVAGAVADEVAGEAAVAEVVAAEAEAAEATPVKKPARKAEPKAAKAGKPAEAEPKAEAKAEKAEKPARTAKATPAKPAAKKPAAKKPAAKKDETGADEAGKGDAPAE
jgi:small subunit ribosomal protein S2